ncbi:MAG: AAA family ATPase [Pseudomonadota bacterium]
MTTEYDLVRGLLLRTMRGLLATHPLAKDLLGFGRRHGPWLFGLTPGKANKLTWSGLKEALREPMMRSQKAHPVLVLGQELSRLLELDETDARILNAMIASKRLQRLSDLTETLLDRGVSLPTMLGEMAGLTANEAERGVRQHILVRLGFVSFKANWRGKVEMSERWTFERLLDQQPGNAEEILELMVGPRQTNALPLNAFDHVREASFLVRLLEGALQEKAAGINILIYGPPGTGKTELARSLADAVGANLHAVGEALEDGEEPDRFDRINAFQMGQRLLGKCAQDLMLFDEMEDFIGDVQPAAGDWFRGREGSKVFVNRLVETNSTPVIWTTNTIGNVDPAILRRMSYVLKLDLPSRATAMRMLERIGAQEGVTPGEEWKDLIERAPETAAVLRVSARAGRLAGEETGSIAAAQSLARALRGRELPLEGPGGIDLALYECDRSIAELVETICTSRYSDISLLLTGPPGTGKTALAHHFARAMDRPLMVQRTSDLLSKWVGQTEENIAQAFANAREKGSVLLLDEVDSLLFDRSHARATWEVSQVNELLTWLDQHPLPVIAATNFAQRLDPATSRRFVFKLALKPLSSQRLGQAFERFFAKPAPASLKALTNLTPGDFALVARQLRYSSDLSAEEIVARLAVESKAKPDSQRRIGF